MVERSPSNRGHFLGFRVLDSGVCDRSGGALSFECMLFVANGLIQGQESIGLARRLPYVWHSKDMSVPVSKGVR